MLELLKRFLKLGLKEPFGCFFSLIISISLISLTAISFVYVIFSIWAVSLIKDTVETSTGFSISADDINVNVFTGDCYVSNLSVKNPDIYKQYDKNSEILMNVSTLNTKLSILSLLNSEFEIESFSAVVDNIDAVRLNSSTGNFREFLTNLLKITKAKKINQNPHLTEFNVVIKSSTYKDVSVKNNIIYWSMDKEFSFKKSDVDDLQSLKKSLKNELIKSNAPFISNGIAETTK